jgi:hypothetical protein
MTKIFGLSERALIPESPGVFFATFQRAEL